MKTTVTALVAAIFVFAALLGGCSKPEEQARTQQKQPVTAAKVPQPVTQPVPAPAVVKPAAPTAAPTAEAETGNTAMKEELIETAKEVGRQAVEQAKDMVPEEYQDTIKAAKQAAGAVMATGAGGTEATEIAPASVKPTAAMPDTKSLEKTVKDKAVSEGMKLPTYK